MAFSLEDKHIIIHYHYIEDPTPENGGMNPCPVSEFEKHIKFLSEHYLPASIPHVFNAAQNNSDDRYYSITLDDGLRGQYENAVPILKKYNAHATLFVITQTLQGVLPYAHKLHIVLSHLSPCEVVDAWNDFLEKEHEEYAVRFFVPKDTRLVKDRRLYSDTPSANIKEILAIVPRIVRDGFFQKLFARVHLDETEACKNMFMNEDEIKNFQNNGFAVGNHTHKHEALHTATLEEARIDFRESKKLLQTIVRTTPTFFSYPYGLISKEHKNFLKEQGITHAVTVEERAVAPTDDPLFIPRYDMVSLRDFLRQYEV